MIHGAGIYANIWGIMMVNVTIYSIHGSYGILMEYLWNKVGYPQMQDVMGYDGIYNEILKGNLPIKMRLI